jgi:16S rRNA (cytidine1402-2'-O)-methyltransferase
MTAKKGKLYLIPLPIADNTSDIAVSAFNRNIIHSLVYIIAENARTARRFMREVNYPAALETVTVFEIEKNNPLQRFDTFISPLLKGENMGLVSEAGCPGVADPGAEIVKLAHQHQIEIVPLIGPSSLLLALMASGLNGQQFCFHGYLPIDKIERVNSIIKLEIESKKLNRTQLFIETPYRNNQMLESLLNNLEGKTSLCIAFNITSENEKIITKPVSEWKKNIPTLDKAPVVFLLLA